MLVSAAPSSTPSSSAAVGVALTLIPICAKFSRVCPHDQPLGPGGYARGLGQSSSAGSARSVGVRALTLSRLYWPQIHLSLIDLSTGAPGDAYSISTTGIL